MTTKQYRIVLVRLGLVLGGLVLGTVLGEVALRALSLPKAGPFLQEFRGERFKVMSYDENPTGAFDLDLNEPAVRERIARRLHDPADFEESWRDTPYGVEFDLNALGFRERAFRPRATPRGLPGAVRRIAIVGDSFTVGHGLPNHLSYPRRLEALLREREARSKGPEVEVLNLGQGDTDLRQVMRVAGFSLKQLDPDILIYGYFLNDPLRTLEADSETILHDMLDAGWTRIEQSRATTRIGQAERGFSRVFDLMEVALADRNVTNSTVDWYQRLHEPEAWRPTRDQIKRLADAARRSEVRFIVLLLPLPFQISEGYPFAKAHLAMADALRDVGVETVDALPALQGFSDEALRLHPRDRHPSPLYAERVSGLLADLLSASAVPAAPVVPAEPASSRPR
ncbi:MAG: hypothetical protein AB8G23_10330 [Myxococcota bacterium]